MLALLRESAGAFAKAHGNRALLWKPLSEPRVPLKVGLVCRDVQRQQATLTLLRTMLEEVMEARLGASAVRGAAG